MPERPGRGGGGRLVPPLPRALGAAGLLPQGLAALLSALDPPLLRAAGVLLASGYAALILSFLGGMWWGLAAAAASPPPRWLWLAAVAPSLWALASLAAGVAVGLPRLALLPLAAAILLTPLIDRRLVRDGLAPHWWMRLRVPLSAGLGLLTAIVAMLSWW